MGFRVVTDPEMSFPPARPPAWQEHQHPAPRLQGWSWRWGMAPSGGCGPGPPVSFPSTGLALQKEGQSRGSQPAATSPPLCRAQHVPHQPSPDAVSVSLHLPSYDRVCAIIRGSTLPLPARGTAHRLPHPGKAGGVVCSMEVWQWWGNVGGTPGRSSPAHSPLKVQGREPGGTAVKLCPCTPSPIGHM